MSFAARMKSEIGLEGSVRGITNDNLTCHNCKFKLDDSKVFGNVSICKVYKYGKPNKILLGKDCELKETEVK